jgi:hypothetical protein
MNGTPQRIFCVLAGLWMVAMAGRIYPQFGDTIRVDGRLTTIASYLRDACGQRVGPAAVTCLAETGEEAELLLRQEQGKSVLVIVTPVILYLLWWPAHRLREALRARRRPMAPT